ncbi:MAG TPA: sulfite exporter TauE/SafE family protein [Pseudomonadales bacterium]
MSLIPYLLLGSIAGTMAGLLGVGGGLVIVPSLIYMFSKQGISPDVLTHMAIGTSLATIVFTSISSIRTHSRHQAVCWNLFATLGIGIVVGAMAGAFVADLLQGRVLQILIGCFAILVSIQMGLGLKPASSRDLPSSQAMIISGSVVGGVSSVFGIGGGSLTVPLLVFFNVPIRQAVGTSAACGLPIALAGAAGFLIMGLGEAELPPLATGYIYWPAFLGITLASVIFAQVGASLAHKIPADTLRKIFALVLFVVGIRFLF